MDDDASAFVLRTVVLAPGSTRTYREAEWRDALVAVTRGGVELECLSGTSYRFKRGDLVWLTGLPLRALHNRGHEPALLLAVSRR
jgi:quercetin dioxygenase-like cupin family protein